MHLHAYPAIPKLRQAQGMEPLLVLYRPTYKILDQNEDNIGYTSCFYWGGFAAVDWSKTMLNSCPIHQNLPVHDGLPLKVIYHPLYSMNTFVTNK